MNQFISDKKVMLFDFDGTLVDTMGVYQEFVRSILSEYPDIDLDKAMIAYLETSGLPFSQQLRMIFPEKNDLFWDEVNKKFEEKKIKMLESVTLNVGVEDALVKLKHDGKKLALSSSTKQALVDRTFSKYADLFDLVLGFREPSFGKGAAHFGEVMKYFAVGPSEIVFIGDSLKDQSIARDFNVPFIAKIGTFSRERFLAVDSDVQCIDSISDLD